MHYDSSSAVLELHAWLSGVVLKRIMQKSGSLAVHMCASMSVDVLKSLDLDRSSESSSSFEGQIGYQCVIGWGIPM